MSPEERQMLADLFERIRANAAAPRDPQADAFINDAVRQQPFAPYILAQTVLVQQHALEGAAQRISELEAQTRASAPAQETSFLGSLGRVAFIGNELFPRIELVRVASLGDELLVGHAFGHDHMRERVD